MMIFVWLAAVALIFGGLVIKRLRPKKFTGLDEMMPWLAHEAVQLARRRQKIKLDYSPASIEQVEVILGKLHDEYLKSKSEKRIKGLAMGYGAYIGEVIRRSDERATWAQDHPQAGERSYPLTWGDGTLFPCAWCYKRVKNGPGDNVWVKYCAIRDRRAVVATDGAGGQGSEAGDGAAKVAGSE